MMKLIYSMRSTYNKFVPAMQNLTTSEKQQPIIFRQHEIDW